MEQNLTITDNAAKKIKIYLEEEEDMSLLLRVFVTGGGCSGFEYGFAFEKDISEDDNTFKKDDIALVVDPISLQYLLGSTIDFKESLAGSRFEITNPNATAQCGCGNSFAA